MNLVLALVAISVVITAVAPLLLARGSWRVRHPSAATRLWLGAFALGTLTLLASLLTALVIVVGHLHTVWFGGYAPTLAAVFVWVGLGAIGALSALAFTRAEPMAKAQRSTEVAVILLAARSRYRVERIGHHHVTYVRSEQMLACSTADGRILVSSAVEEALPAEQVRAIIEHERAHLLGWHARVLQLARLNSACFPFLPSAREFERTVSLLLELAADDAAARICGPATVCNALAVLGALQGDAGMELRAERLASYPVTSRRRQGLVPSAHAVLG